MKLSRTKAIAITACCIALIAIFFVSDNTVYTTSEKAVEKTPVFINPFASTTLQSKAVFVYAPTSKHVMFQSNAHIPLPLASVTKIMTAYVASTILDDEEIITLTSDDLLAEGDHGLLPGEAWKFSDLRDVMLVASANDAAEAIRRATDEKLALLGASTTIGIMNEKAYALGLYSIVFQSVSGLDNVDGTASAYGNARDIAIMFTDVIYKKPEIFESTRESSVVRGPQNGLHKVFKNTNLTVNDMPAIIASKTGYTDAAGGNLIAAFDAGLGSPIVIAVLGSINQETRFEDMMELSEKALKYINGTYYSGI